MLLRSIFLCFLAPLSVACAYAAEADTKSQQSTSSLSSSAFCLFELPNAGNVKQRHINLGIVQYVEILPDELRISYGGGSFGSGHEASIPIKTREEGAAIIQRMRQTARDCK